MECTSVQSEIDVVVFVTRVWQVFLCLFLGIILGICVAIFVFICWHKVFDKGKKCSKDRCCLIVAFGALKKQMRRSSSAMYDMMLNAWEDSDSDSDNERSQLTGETVTIFIEKDEGETRVLVHDDAAVSSDTIFTYSTMGMSGTTIDQEQHNESYLDARPDSGQRYRPVTLAEILSQPNQETSYSLMFENEKKSILKIEANFIQQKSDLFLFMLDCICTQIVMAELASEDWKQSLREYCFNAFVRTKKRARSHSISNLESLLPRMPETFQINMNAVVANLLDYLHKSLEKETEVGVMEVEEIMNEFQTNWSAFERIHSDIYLNQLRVVNHHFMKRAKIIEAIEQENSELMDEMIQHVDKHVNALRGIQSTSTDAYFDISRSEDRLAPELEEIWQSTLERFQMDLRRQKIQLSMEIQEQLDVEKKKYATNYEQELQDIQVEVIREDGSMKDYVDKYCEMLQSQFEEHMRLTQLETQITANGFSSLTEAVGSKYLQAGMRTEGDLYADFLERSNWVDPNVTEVITQHQNNLVELQANLKELKKMQYNRLQTKINERMEEKKVAKLETVDDINAQHKSIKEVIELQADLSEGECQQLLDQCMAQQRSFEAQLELNRIKQERRLEQRLRQQRAKLSKAMKQVNSDDSIHPEAKLRASLRYKQEEKELLDSHHQSMEELKRKMHEEIEEAKKTQDLFFQQKLEHLRRGHERRLLLANKQEQAIKSLKDKLLNRLASGAEQMLGERMIKEHQINKEVLEETIQKNKLHQQQVLQQKLQIRKLDKKQEKEKDFKNETKVEPYHPGSAKRFAANALVSLLFEVRHKRAVKKLEAQLAGEGDRIKLQIERKFRIHSTLELQLRETEMVAKLAAVLGMTRGELESELKTSVKEQGHGPDSEYGVLLSRSVMAIFDGHGTDVSSTHTLYQRDQLNSANSS